MSTRALGSLIDRNGLMEVQDDLRFTTAGDIVADPSAQRAFMQGIQEQAEWVFNPATNSWETMKLLEYTKKVAKILNEQEIFKIFHKYITNLSK